MRRKSRKSTHRKRSGRREHALGHPQAVAVGELLDQRGRDRPLEVDVQLRERERSYAPEQHRSLGGRLGADVTAASSAVAASAALASPRAWTIASGRSGPTCAPIGGDLRQPDAGVDLVVLATAVAAQAGDDEADGARVHARRRSRGARGRPGA